MQIECPQRCNTAERVYLSHHCVASSSEVLSSSQTARGGVAVLVGASGAVAAAAAWRQWRGGDGKSFKKLALFLISGILSLLTFSFVSS